MGKKEFRKVMVFMYKAFRQEPNEDEFETYYLMLKEYDIDMIKKSAYNICKTSDFFPRVKNIIEGMVEVPEERMVADEILKIAEDSNYATIESIECSHDITRAIVDDIGLNRLGLMSPEDLKNTIHFKYRDISPVWKRCQMENREFLISTTTPTLKRSNRTQSLKELL